MASAQKVSVFRKAQFNAAHRLNNPDWDEETNRKVFGKCNNLNYHGHNYQLIVGVRGEVDPLTGYVMDIRKLNQIIEQEVIERYDHLNLNLDLPEFRNTNPTVENMVVEIWNRLRSRIRHDLTLSVRLYETERNFVEYSGEARK